MIEFPGGLNPARPEVKSAVSGTGYLAEPRGGNGPGVLLLHAWWGLNDVIKAFADDLAGADFTVLAPDLYGDDRPPAATIEEAEKRSSAAESETGGVAVEQRVLGAADWLVKNTTGPIAAVGFSFGAGYALWLGVKRPEDLRAIVVYYGTYPGVGGRAPVMGHFATDDPYEPAERVDAFEAGLREVGRTAQFHRYADTKHWFAEPDRPEYDAEAASEARERSIAFLNENLGA